MVSVPAPALRFAALVRSWFGITELDPYQVCSAAWPCPRYPFRLWTPTQKEAFLDCFCAVQSTVWGPCSCKAEQYDDDPSFWGAMAAKNSFSPSLTWVCRAGGSLVSALLRETRAQKQSSRTWLPWAEGQGSNLRQPPGCLGQASCAWVWQEDHRGHTQLIRLWVLRG